MQIEGFHESATGSCLAGRENDKMTVEYGGNDIIDSNGNVMLFSLLHLSFPREENCLSTMASNLVNS